MLALCHGPAAVERGVSVKNKVLHVNLHERSITSCKLIIDHMNCHSLLPQSFPILNHGPAAVEREFSMNNKVLNVNMHKISVTFCKLTIDHMNCHNLLAQSFPITKSLLKSVRCSRQRYQEFLREKESL